MRIVDKRKVYLSTTASVTVKNNGESITPVEGYNGSTTIWTYELKMGVEYDIKVTQERPANYFVGATVGEAGGGIVKQTALIVKGSATFDGIKFTPVPGLLTYQLLVD